MSNKKQMQQQLNRFYSTDTPSKEIAKVIGINKVEFIQWINKHFIEEMDRSNYGTVWQLDHVVPIHMFNLSKVDDMALCFHHMNIIPLLNKDNKFKGASVHFSLHILNKRLIDNPDNKELLRLISLCNEEVNTRWNKYM